MLTIVQERSPLMEINFDATTWEMSFSANGEHLVSDDNVGVRA